MVRVSVLYKLNDKISNYGLFNIHLLGIYEVPAETSKTKAPVTTHSPFTEPVSAILAPSSITHKQSPTLQIKTRELDPSADTGKDTQHLVEEDKSEC